MAFARWTASSAPSTTSIAATGPKVSSRAKAEPSGTSVSSVAWNAGPTASPPASTFAPCETASSTRARTVFSACSVISGPMIVSCSFGSPALRPRVFSASRCENSSAIERSTMIRRVDMQIWPWWRNEPKAAASTA